MKNCKVDDESEFRRGNILKMSGEGKTQVRIKSIVK